VDNCQAWSFQQNEWRRHDKEMEPREKEKRLAAYRDETNRMPEEDHSQIVSARSISWAECREKKQIFRHRAEGKVFLLTFPYIGLLQANSCVLQLRVFCFPGSALTPLGSLP